MTDQIESKGSIQLKLSEAHVSASEEEFHYSLWQLFVIELLGTFLLVLFGNSCVACIFLSVDANAGPNDANQLYWSIGYGLGLFFALLPSASISGGHLNPAVTISMLTLRKVKVLEALVYIAGQFLGSFLSAAVLFGLYIDRIKDWEANRIELNSESIVNYSLNTAGIFATYPNADAGLVTCFFDQVVGTAFLLFAILAITDSDNLKISKPTQLVAISSMLTLILMAFGSNCGGALNPARDLAPRIFTAMAGWGGAVFSVRNYAYFWIPIVGPVIGGIIGSWVYQLISMIRRSANSANKQVETFCEKL